MYPPLCGRRCILCIPSSPTGRPYPLGGPRRTGGTRVYPKRKLEALFPLGICLSNMLEVMVHLQLGVPLTKCGLP